MRGSAAKGRDDYCEPAGPCEIECVDGCQDQGAARDRHRFYRCSSGALVNIAEAAEEVCFAWANGAQLDRRIADLAEALHASYEEAVSRV